MFLWTQKSRAVLKKKQVSAAQTLSKSSNDRHKHLSSAEIRRFLQKVENSNFKLPTPVYEAVDKAWVDIKHLTLSENVLRTPSETFSTTKPHCFSSTEHQTVRYKQFVPFHFLKLLWQVILSVPALGTCFSCFWGTCFQDAREEGTLFVNTFLTRYFATTRFQTSKGKHLVFCLKRDPTDPFVEPETVTCDSRYSTNRRVWLYCLVLPLETPLLNNSGSS